MQLQSSTDASMQLQSSTDASMQLQSSVEAELCAVKNSSSLDILALLFDEMNETIRNRNHYYIDVIDCQ